LTEFSLCTVVVQFGEGDLVSCNPTRGIWLRTGLAKNEISSICTYVTNPKWTRGKWRQNYPL